MTYVLIYINGESQPAYIQGTLEHINKKIQQLWLDGDIDRDDWEFSSPFELLCIEDGVLTRVNSWEMTPIPQFVVN